MPRVDHLNRRPDDVGITNIEALRKKIIELDDLILFLCPVNRERLLALTKLEECMMWTVKSLVMKYPVDEIT